MEVIADSEVKGEGSRGEREKKERTCRVFLLSIEQPQEQGFKLGAPGQVQVRPPAACQCHCSGSVLVFTARWQKPSAALLLLVLVCRRNTLDSGRASMALAGSEVTPVPVGDMIIMIVLLVEPVERLPVPDLAFVCLCSAASASHGVSASGVSRI